MYAVFEDCSRQYRVAEGDVVRVDFRDLPAGGSVEFPRVLLHKTADGLKIGQPFVEGIRVLGEVVGHPSEKVYVQHFRRRKNYRRLRGHRQPYTAVRVRSIGLPGSEVLAPPAEPATPAPQESAPVAVAPVEQAAPAPVESSAAATPVS